MILTVMKYKWFRVKHRSNAMPNKTIHNTITKFLSMLTEDS